MNSGLYIKDYLLYEIYVCTNISHGSHNLFFVRVLFMQRVLDKNNQAEPDSLLVYNCFEFEVFVLLDRLAY